MKKNWTEEQLLELLLDEKQVPFTLLAKAFGTRAHAHRKKKPSGRPPIFKKCPICGEMLTALQRRSHKH